MRTGPFRSPRPTPYRRFSERDVTAAGGSDHCGRRAPPDGVTGRGSPLPSGVHSRFRGPGRGSPVNPVKRALSPDRRRRAAETWTGCRRGRNFDAQKRPRAHARQRIPPKISAGGDFHGAQGSLAKIPRFQRGADRNLGTDQSAQPPVGGRGPPLGTERGRVGAPRSPSPARSGQPDERDPFGMVPRAEGLTEATGITGIRQAARRGPLTARQDGAGRPLPRPGPVPVPCGSGNRFKDAVQERGKALTRGSPAA